MQRDRRSALKTLGSVACAAGVHCVVSPLRAMGGLLPGPPPSPPSGSSPAVVAIAQRKGLLGPRGSLTTALADEVLGRSIARAGGEETPVQALRRIFSPHDIVGIKVNCLAGRGLSPHPYLVERLVRWLEEAGLPGRNILVWDRYDRELRAAGFTLSRRGAKARCFGTENNYDWTPREWGPGGSCFARVLTDQITALINFGVLKDHDLAGVSAGLKNWYGVIHNPNKFHDDGCYPFVAHLAGHELIRKKHRLTILDASSAQYHGGPARAAQWSWPFEAVLASCDPLALDAVALSLIEAKRAEHKLPTLKAEKRYPRWIAEAARLGLGEAELARIEQHSL